MTKVMKNASSMPSIFYGLHMVEGVAEYAEPNKEAYRIYIGQDTIKSMNPTFAGKPVYVDHVEEVDLANIQEEADGYVVESFYNKTDGKNWAKFIVISDRAKNAIRSGWKLSNAYIPTGFSTGGENHGVQFSKEVTSGEYEHLAIVQNPRYEESVILTPEEFKSYNAEKEAELARLTNSKEKNKVKFNLFKKQKVENSVDLTGLMVELPKSKAEMLLTDVVEKYDVIHNMQGYAHNDHMVKLNDSTEMSVGDLVKKHIEACNELEELKKKGNDGEGEPGAEVEVKENDEDQEDTIDHGQKDVGTRGGDKSLDNEGKEDMPEHEEDEKKKKKNEAKSKAQALKNAGPQKEYEHVARVDLGSDKVARGKARYGSDA